MRTVNQTALLQRFSRSVAARWSAAGLRPASHEGGREKPLVPRIGQDPTRHPNSCFSLAVLYNSLLADLAACRHVMEVKILTELRAFKTNLF